MNLASIPLKTVYTTLFRVVLLGAIAGSLNLVFTSSARADVVTTESSSADALSLPISTNNETEAIAPSEQSQLVLENDSTSLEIPSESEIISSQEVVSEANSRLESEITPTVVLTPVETDPSSTHQTINSEIPALSTTNQVSTSTGLQILTPILNTVLDTPATTIILQFPVGSEVVLRVNGETVNSELIGRTETDSTTNLVTQTWYGVGLRDGENEITAQSTFNGAEQAPVTISVIVRGAPTQLTVEPVEAGIPADRRSTATIQGELLDDMGNRSNRDAVITLEASSGEFAGADFNTDQPGFQVQARQGQYTATLRSSLNSGITRIRATSNELEAFNQIEFQTSVRPTLVSGVVDVRLGARGTDYFGSFRDFLPADGDNSFEVDVDAAAFITTPVGEWQFTGAFNSDRPLNRDCNDENPLFREGQACDQNYPVYGDSSTSDIVTPSTDQVYLRLERTSPVQGAGSDFIMWGDYDTSNEFAVRSQFYTATNRQLHGLYGNYNLGNLRITGFYGNNVQGFQRDTIAPDGTSGYYFLSRRLLIGGSENVFIETEEFNRPGTVIESEPLVRGADYQIDYDRGSLLFNRPILRTDIDDQGRVLVRRIVVTYQYDNNDDDANIFGGRLQYNFSRELNRESWIGATFIHESQGTHGFELYGADALISFGEDGQIIAEYAHSRNSSDFLGTVSGSAFRVDAQTTLFDDVQAHVYYRHTDAGFSNNSTTSFVPGQTRYGAEIQARLSETTTLRAAYDHEDNFGTAPRSIDNLADLLNPGSEATPGSRVDNSLTSITVGIEQRIDDATLSFDWIHRDRQDRIEPNALSSTSDQVRSRLVVPITDNVTFRAQNEFTLSGEDPLYPNRTIFGVDWEVHPGITVSLNHQFFTTESGENAITSFDINGEYNLARDTRVHGRFSLISGHGLAGNLGIQQGITVAPGLRLTLAYEHIFESEFNYTGAGAQFPQPYAVAQSASGLGVQGGDSFSVGLEYTDNPDFQANARFDHRTSSSGSNTVITASALGRITPSLTALLNFQQASAANQQLAGLGTTTTLRFGLAYRNPNNDDFNALLRYEYRRNPAITPEDLISGSGTGSQEHLFAVEAIYAPNWRWEFYGKFALRNSTSYLASDLVGTSTVTLAQLRATYRLGYRWDIAAEARWISQPTADYSETGVAIEAGYYLSPNLRLSAGYSFGNISDRDFNGSRSASGPYVGITLKLDNNLFRDFGVQQAASPQQQESVIEPVVETPSSNPLTLAPLNFDSSQPNP